MKNWKTTLAGIAILIGASGEIINKPTKATDISTWTQVAAGIGLLFGKDHNVTGGTKQQ